jgi:transcriptional regulator with XRE-family HTH domain
MKELKDIKIVFDTEFYNERKKELGYTDAHIARLAGLAKEKMWRYKKNLTIPTSFNLYRVAMALECSMEDLLMEI